MRRQLVTFALALAACGQENLVDSRRDRGPAIRGLLSGPTLTRTIESLAAPILNVASPPNMAMGGPDFVLTVLGSGFISESVLRWNGEDRATQFVSSGQLTANISASDISIPGLKSLTVFNSGENGGESNALAFAVFISQICNDIIYDPIGGLIWASVPSIFHGNGVISVDPYTGERSPLVFVGSEPGKLAITDDESLFVALNGAGAVRKFDIPTRTAGIFFSLGRDSFYGPMFAQDLQVLPGYSDSVAVSRVYQFVIPRHAGVGIYDFGVMRPTQTPGHTGSNVIQFSNSPDRLYGYSSEGDQEFRRMRIDDSGVTTESETTLIGGAQDIRFDSYDGRIYSNNGVAIDPEQRIVLGTFPNTGGGSLVLPDSANGRTFYLTYLAGLGHTLRVFDPNTYVQIGQVQLPGISGTATSLIRWSDDGLAFRAGTNQIFIATSPVPAMPAAGRRSVNQR